MARWKRTVTARRGERDARAEGFWNLEAATRLCAVSHCHGGCAADDVVSTGADWAVSNGSVVEGVSSLSRKDYLEKNWVIDWLGHVEACVYRDTFIYGNYVALALTLSSGSQSA